MNSYRPYIKKPQPNKKPLLLLKVWKQPDRKTSAVKSAGCLESWSRLPELKKVQVMFRHRFQQQQKKNKKKIHFTAVLERGKKQMMGYCWTQLSKRCHSTCKVKCIATVDGSTRTSMQEYFTKTSWKQNR